MERKSERCNCCSNFSIFFLVVVNVIIGAGGLLLAGLGGYLLKNFNQFSELISQNAAAYLTASGVILFILAIVAIIGALYRAKKLLGVYAFLLVAVVACEIVVAFFAVQYLDFLQTTVAAAANNVTASSELDAQEILINNFLLRAYETCCVNSNSGFCDAPLSCTSVPTCVQLASDSGICIDDTSVGSVDAAICTALSGFKVAGNSIVGPADEACGLGDPASFLSDFSDYMTAKINLVAYVSAGVGFLELLLIGFTLYLVFSGVNYKKLMPNDDPLDLDPRAQNDSYLPIAAQVSIPTAAQKRQQQRESQRMQQVALRSAAAAVSPTTYASANDEAIEHDEGFEETFPSQPRGRATSGLSSQLPGKSVYTQGGRKRQASISFQKMEENPEVIDDVI